MTTVVPTSEEDPTLAVVRSTAELSCADAGAEAKIDVGPTENLVEENVSGKKKKKRKKKIASEDETQNTPQTESTENVLEGDGTNEREMKNLAEGNVSGKKKRKRIKKTATEEETQNTRQTESTENVLEGDGTNEREMKNLAEGTVSGKKERKRKKKTASEDETQNTRQTESKENVLEGDGTNEREMKNLAEGTVSGKKERKRKKKTACEDETQNTLQTESTENVLEGNGTNEKKMKNRAEGEVSGKKERKRKKKTASEDETQNTRQIESTENVLEGDGTNERKMKNLVEGEVSGKTKKKRMKKTTSEDETQNTCQTESTENVLEGDGTNERKMRENKTVKEETKDVTTNISSSDVKNAECLCPLNSQITSTRRRKLLVLDLNGVLADIVRPPVPAEVRRGTKSIFGQAIVKRPFYDDFLNFCFENFDVGIWSSRSRHRVPMIVDYLLGHLKRKLVFCWDMTHVTPTGFQTLENSKKPLVLKELRKIWDNNDPRLGWKKGDYDQSNTLLLDDSPFKALLNPEHTAIFPTSYCYTQKDDKSLGPGGNLRVYLEGLLASENVQDYVEQNPYGQPAITKQNQSWGFYQRVLNSVSSQLKNQNSFSRGWY